MSKSDKLSRDALKTSSPPQFEFGHHSATERLITDGVTFTAHDIQMTGVSDIESGSSSEIASYSDPSVNGLGGVGGTYKLHFQNLTFSVKPKRRNSNRLVILNDVSGYCESGRLLSVMGRSGAGKTTLVRLIT